MKSIFLQNNGNKKSVDVGRKKLVQDFDIHNRDLRPVFLSNQIATMSVRGECIVMNLGTVKCVIGETSAYFFNTTHKSTAELVEKVIKKVKSNTEELQNFTLIVLETIIAERFIELEHRYEFLEKKTKSLLNSLKKELSEEKFEKLLTIKKQLSTLETKVQEAHSPMSDILDDEEEMLELVKISQHTKQEKKEDMEDEIESIFEGHLEQIESVLHKISELDENIDDTQEIITLKMANIRNTIIRFDLLISIITASMAFPAVLVGLYGMNVPNFAEKIPHAFGFISLAIGGFLLLMLVSSWWYLKRKKILN